MTDREARAVGRWCSKHGRQHERVPLDGGAAGWATGCPVCLTSSPMQEAIRELVKCAIAEVTRAEADRDRAQNASRSHTDTREG